MAEHPEHLAPFLVGDHPALDFLNSLAQPAGKPVEWLGSGAEFLAWLGAAGLLDGDEIRRAAGAHLEGELDRAAEQARDLRAWWSHFVRTHAGAPLRAEVGLLLGPLNALLERDDSYRSIAVGEAGPAPPSLAWCTRRRFANASALLSPIAQAIGELVVEEDFALVRHCDGPGCTLAFLDRTKNHRRRWCSTALCGNRTKVAAFRARSAGEDRSKE